MHIATTVDVLNELQHLDAVLLERGMSQFTIFNHAYYIVTEEILEAMNAGYFENPRRVDVFIVLFAQYYFDALNDAAAHTLLSSSPWLRMDEYAKISRAPVFLSLLLGANAHINYDLPQALKLFVDQDGDGRSLNDLTKISKILMRSGKMITRSFDEPNTHYDFFKRRLRPLYYRPAMYTILYWRLTAWKEYGRLETMSDAPTHISRRSLRIAARLLFIARRLAVIGPASSV
jgi:hypothetical protein